MNNEEIIKELKEAKQTLVADNYKTWSYVVMAIDRAIKALTHKPQKVYFGTDGSYIEEDKVGDEIRIRVVQKNGDVTYLK